MANYTWHVDRIERTLSDGRVDKVYYHVTATEGESSVNEYGVLELAGPVGTPYEQLTEQIVIGWLHSELGGLKASKEASVGAVLQERITPTRGSGLPWEVVGQTTEPRSLA